MVQLPFSDRRDAGGYLAEELARHKHRDHALVLALPRGGVPVGFAIAERLRLPLDVIVARKLGVPWQPELAMGAIAGSARFLDEEMIRNLGITGDEVDLVAKREQAVMESREALFRGGRPPLDLHNRAVILVDDGLATGSTMRAAVRCVRSQIPAAITIAVPVGSREACAQLRTECDDFVCLSTPDPFYAVGMWFRDFAQVGDAEVHDLLVRTRHGMPNAQAVRAGQ